MHSHTQAGASNMMRFLRKLTLLRFVALCVVAVSAVKLVGREFFLSLTTASLHIHTDTHDVEARTDIRGGEAHTYTQSIESDTDIRAPVTQPPGPRWLTFQDALADVASDNKTVVLAMVDTGYVDMAQNFHESSIMPHNITNMLYVSVAADTCRELQALKMPCYTFSNVSGKGDYMSKAFLGKMNVRTNFIYLALTWGYSIVQVDIDLIFLKNPFGYFTCKDCAIESLEDGVKNYINCGFLILKARNATVNVYKKMVAKAITDPMSEDQRNLNGFVKQMKVKYRVLSSKEFVCGLDYYEKPRRYFVDTAAPCPACVVVHNNWIVSKQAKIYRFKEMGQWLVDNDGYYSDPSVKYITYENHKTLPPGKLKKKEFDSLEKNALRTALAVATILNRILILPKFHCEKTLCGLNNYIYIRNIDQNFSYREHSFLRHPKVPQGVKSDLSKIMQLVNINTTHSSSSGEVFVVENPSGVKEEEIVRWFGGMKETVLQFKDLYTNFAGFSDSEQQNMFDQKIQASFKYAGYRQY